MDSSDSHDHSSVETVEENPLPNPASTEEVTAEDSGATDQVRYVIVQGSSQRQRPKLIDDRGYSYTQYSSNKDGSVTWRCSVRNSQVFCGTRVRQVGDNFYASGKEHCHAGTPGEHITAQVLSQVKQKASECLFEPAEQIVNEVLGENLAEGAPAPSLPTPRSLARTANRFRQKQDPRHESDLVFDLRLDAATQEELNQNESASHLEENPTMEEATDSESALLGRKFNSYDEVERFIREYEDANFVKYFKMNSRSVACSRRRLPKRFVSDNLRYVTVMFACVHHGQHRSTSKGLRPRQKTLRMGCPAKFRFSATPDGKQLYVAVAVTEHSHPRNAETFRSMPQKRRLTDTEREEACQILQKKGKKSAQMHFQEKTGKVLTMKDLHNLAAMSRQQSICYTNIQAILDYLSETEDQSSVVEVVTKADGRIVGIFYQDQEMRRVYASYPQHLTVDASCKYNSLRMPLYIMLAEDGNGDSEIIAVFLVIASNAESVRSMLLRFKEHNPAWSDIQIIRADKDFTERQVLTEEFPSASVQICLHHVLRRLEQDTSKQHLCSQKEETSYCLRLMQKLAASKSESAYLENYKELTNTGLQTMIEYYNSTWHNCRHEWVEGLKSRSLMLKNAGPDKLASADQLLRAVFRNSPAPEQVMVNLKKVIELLREERDHSAAAALIEDPPQTNPTNSPVSQFEKYLTPLALKHVLRQLKLSWKVKVKKSIDAKSSSVKSSHGTLIVSIDTCPCRFWHSLCLPCRHIFAVRRIKGLPLFAKETISSRWSMEHYKSTCRLSAQNSDSFLDAEALQRHRVSLLSRAEKHTHISEITKQLATVVSEAPAEKFSGQVEAVKKLLSLFQRGSAALVTEVVSEVAEPATVANEEVRDEATHYDATQAETELETLAQGGAVINGHDITAVGNSITVS